MKPEVKTKWLEALRSGHYPQTRNTLRNSGEEYDSETGEYKLYIYGYCCLGVLCEVHHQEHPENTKWTSSDSYHSGGDGLYATNYLDEGVTTWAELRQSNPYVDLFCPLGLWDIFHPWNGKVIRQMTLAELNDSGEWSFEDIANIVEHQL